MKMYSLFAAMALCTGSAVAQGQLSSGIDKANMDLTADPGKDFFQYAAGGWMKSHPLTAEYSRFAQFDALQEVNREQIKVLVEELAQGQHAQGTLEQKIGGLYCLAMDEKRLNDEGFAPIRPLLEKIGAVKTQKEFQYCMAELKRKGIGSFFSVYCGADMKNSKMNLMQVSQGGLSMGNRDYYLDQDERTKGIREAYRKYAQSLFEKVGNTSEQAQNKVEALMNIETRIAKVSYTPTQLRDVANNYHKMSYTQLLNDYPGIDWSTYFFVLGVPTFNEISVSQPEPIKEVAQILNDSQLEDLKAYLEFKVINDAASYMSDDFRALYFDFFNKTMKGAESDNPRWKRALSSVEGALGMAVGRMYVEKHFPESSKTRMVQLVKNLQEALGQRIDAQVWMSAETKAKAHEKLNTFHVKIGYPDTWQDYSALTIDENLSYYENMMVASEFSLQDHFQKRVNKPVDRDEWLMTPHTINAYYNPTTNEICFPAAILQPPFFNPNADDACNYGAIGVVIGHEMTHGFDDKGSLFDKDGNLKNWWTEADQQKFADRTKVMEDFFNKIEVLPGMFANGKLTLGENIADHGGLKISYQAMQNAMKKNPMPVMDGFTAEQRFFLSYGVIWANNIREQMLRQLNKVDPHSAGRWRVNGALPHIEAWYKAFDVKKSDPLYLPKKQRLDIW